MPGQPAIRVEGIVRDKRPPATFVVELANGHWVFARVLLKQREKMPGIKLGDRVNLNLAC